MQRRQLQLLHAQVDERARHGREADRGALAVERGELARIEPDAVRTPGPRRLEHAVLELDPAAGDREVIDADADRPAGLLTLPEQIGDVVAVRPEPDDPRVWAGEREVLDP